MTVYRELETPATAFSPAAYRLVECTEEEMLARLARAAEHKALLTTPASHEQTEDAGR